MVAVLAVLLFTSILLAFASFLHNEQWQDYNERFLLIAGDQQVLAQQIAVSAAVAARGDEAAFGRLRDGIVRFDKDLKDLKQGDPEQGLPPSPQEVSETLQQVENAWLELREAADEIAGARESILSVRNMAQSTGAILPCSWLRSSRFCWSAWSAPWASCYSAEPIRRMRLSKARSPQTSSRRTFASC